GSPRSRRRATQNAPASASRIALDSPPLSGLEPAPVGEGDLLAGDELEQDGLSVGVQLPSSLQGGNDVGGLLDALGLAAHRAAHFGGASPAVPPAVAGGRNDERRPPECH